MKTSIITTLFSVLFLATTSSVVAQKYAYVNTDYIMDQIPAVKESQSQLDELSAQWQKEVEAKFAEVDRLYKAYLKEQILLTEDLKKKREEEIIEKEKEAKDFQKSKFGTDGELFRKRQELIKPIQKEIWDSIEKLAKDGNYAVIFDKSGSSNILYSNPRYDLSDDVLKEMGITPTNND